MSVSIRKTGIVLASGDIGANLLKSELKSYTPTAYCACQINLSENMIANTTYTVQLWNVNVSHTGKTAADLGIDIYWGGGNMRMAYWHGTSYFTSGHADYLIATFTVTSSQASSSDAANAWFNVYNSSLWVSGTMNLTIGKWKIEKGSIPTDWIPNVNDADFVGNNSGFNEASDIAQITKGYVNAPDFQEY